MSTINAARNVLDTLNSLHSFSTFLRLLEYAGIMEELQGDGPFTVFAPTDSAVERLPHSTLRDLLNPGNAELLYDIASYHIVRGEVRADQLKSGLKLDTLGGQHLTACDDRAGQICLDRAHILQGDIVCTNGLLHAIDKVLLPGNRD